jgi:PAS domain S-box-containing protein
VWVLTDERFREFLDQVPVVFFADTDEPVARTVYASASCEAVLGSSPQEHLDDADLWWRSIHPDDLDAVMEAWTEAYRTKEPLLLDYRYVRPDGRTIWVREREAPIRDDDGTVTHWQGVLLDVTADRDALGDLERSIDRHRALLEHLPAFLYAVTDEVDFQILYASPHGYRTLGYDAEDPDWLSLTYEDILHPDDRDRVLHAWRHAVQTGETFELEYRQVGNEGRVVWVHDRATLVSDRGRRSHWQGIVLDVTARVDAETAARVARRRFETIEGQLPVVVYAVSDDLEPASLYISPNAVDVLGHPASEYLEGRQVFPAFVHPEDRAEVAASWDRAWAKKTPFDAGYRVTKSDGTIVWVRDTCQPLRTPDGGVGFWQGVMLDVTAERLARLELEASEARRRALVENLPAVVYEMAHDDDRRTLYISSSIQDLLGYSPREWLEQPDIWSELLHPEDREVELDAHDRHSETGEPWSREYRMIAAAGGVVWVRDVARLVPTPDGSTWQGVFVDITAQKQAEDVLRQTNDELEMSVLTRMAELEEANALMELEVGERRRAERDARAAEERYRGLVDAIPAVVYRWEVPDHITTGAEFVSPAIEPMLGYTVEEWSTAYLWRERLHPHDAERVIAASDRSERTGEPLEIEYRYLARDGRVVWVLDRAVLIARNDDGRPASFQGVMVDVTSRKEAEAKADEAEARFRDFVEGGPMVAYAYHLDPVDPPVVHTDYVSPRLADLIGLAPEDLGGFDHWLELVHPDDRSIVVEHARTEWASGLPWTTRYRMIATSGEIVVLEDRGVCVERDPEGRPCRFHGAITDVTEGATIEAALRGALAAVDGAVAGGPAVTWTEVLEADGRSRYTFISPQSLELFGYRPEELMEELQHFPRLVHPDDRDRVLAVSLAADDAEDGLWQDEYRAVHRDGSVRLVLSSGRRATPRGIFPAVWHGIAVDVTGRHAASASPVTGHADAAS